MHVYFYLCIVKNKLIVFKYVFQNANIFQIKHSFSIQTIIYLNNQRSAKYNYKYSDPPFKCTKRSVRNSCKKVKRIMIEQQFYFIFWVNKSICMYIEYI